MNKKGMSLGSLYSAVLVLVLIGIVIGVGIFILDESSKAMSNTLITVTNETGINASGGSTLSHVTDCGASSFLAIEVNNGTEIASTEYTLTSDGVITDDSGVAQVQLWNVTYSYRGIADQSTTTYCGVIETTETGVGTFATWIAVIVVVIAAAIILGLVINSFGRRNGV